MKKILISLFAVTVAILPATVWPEDGFILKSGEGEILGNGIVVKASPRTGTEDSILVEQTFARGGTTGLHLHRQGDEMFYIVSGRGTATLNGLEKTIGPGDMMFVPASAAHRIRNIDNDDPLTVVFFMDSPELVDLFRAIHERYQRDPNRPITPDEFANFERQTGGGKSVN